MPRPMSGIPSTLPYCVSRPATPRSRPAVGISRVRRPSALPISALAFNSVPRHDSGCRPYSLAMGMSPRVSVACLLLRFIKHFIYGTAARMTRRRHRSGLSTTDGRIRKQVSVGDPTLSMGLVMEKMQDAAVQMVQLGHWPGAFSTVTSSAPYRPASRRVRPGHGGRQALLLAQETAKAVGTADKGGTNIV
jgi:hypothetical protein